MLENPKRGTTPVDPQIEPACNPLGEPGRTDPVSLLERGDLGEIEHVMDVHPTPGELDAAVPVDREVAQRMCGCCAGKGSATSPRRSASRLIAVPSGQPEA